MSEFRNDAEERNTNEPTSSDISQFVLVLQIICGSLIGGVLIFGGFVLLQPGKPPVNQPTLSYLAAAFTAVTVVLWLALPRIMDKMAVKHVARYADGSGRPDADAVAGGLMAQYQARKIVQMAALEGAAFMNLVAYWLEHVRWSLGVIGGLVLLMLLSFPTRGRIRNWAQSLIQRWEAKSFGGGER